MYLEDIIGPVMVGPSSSHTAGAARIGKVAYMLLGEKVKHADILLHGSFFTTGKGHGTDKALVAGLIGMSVDDVRIPRSFDIAAEQGMTYRFGEVDLGGDAHPNSVMLALTGVSGKRLEVVAASIGGGRIRVTGLDGMQVNFAGDMPTIVIEHNDHPGVMAQVTSLLLKENINIATTSLYRSGRGAHAQMVLECDQEVPEVAINFLRHQEDILRVIYFSQQTGQTDD